MTLHQRIIAFNELGNHLRQISPEAFDSLAESARQENPWFTAESVRNALNGISKFLKEDSLSKWCSAYSFNESSTKTIALVMAGNIPLVGFHDFLSVLISGHKVQIKFSSKDSKLLSYLIKHLIWFEPTFEKYIEIKESKLENFDAVIATGSDNSSRYFHQYFGKYPHIIRKNRTSVAILSGNETEEELTLLGEDAFSYFGLGCRNISKVFAPIGYDFTKLLDSWKSYEKIINHHKYSNNYDYQKSILLVNRSPFLDSGFVLLQENERLISPISVVFYEFYLTPKDLTQKISMNEEKLQCIVGKEKPATVEIGHAQYPELWDYADQVDTLKFLTELK